jgi:hypothetical protein
LRNPIDVIADPALGRNEAIAEVALANRSTYRSHVKVAHGSADRPMTDDELDAKFTDQANGILLPQATSRLLHLCRDVAFVQDDGKQIGAALKT